jgi:hypothetical protein
MSIIYSPSGPANEYAQLACNYYCFCTHGCRYCYRLPFVSARKFHQAGVPKNDAINRLRKDVLKLRGLTPVPRGRYSPFGRSRCRLLPEKQLNESLITEEYYNEEYKF